MKDKDKDDWFDMCDCGDDCNCSIEPTEMEKELYYLELLNRRIDVADGLLLLRDSQNNPLYTAQWVKENILKI